MRGFIPEKCGKSQEIRILQKNQTTHHMNKYIEDFILDTYGFNLENATAKDLSSVEEILVRDVTMNGKYSEWDFSQFPNVRRIDCSYNPISKLDVTQNPFLEKLSWAGTRGEMTEMPDLSQNIHLKSLIAGQDGLREIDLSNNPELEELTIFLSSSLRWIELSNCTHLKSIDMEGVNIPFVDLTNCKELEYVNISYMNLYRRRDDEFGPGYPRPFVFVDEKFDESIIPQRTREYSYYTYLLIRVKKGSVEEKFLEQLKKMRDYLLMKLPSDHYGIGVAKMHYELLDVLKELRRKNN